jgi:hypothetical protein
MIHAKEAFVKILLIELEDLEEDIHLLQQRYTQEHQQHQISDYVFMENVALLHNELYGIEGFYSEVRGLALERYDGLDAVLERLHTIIRSRCHERGIAPFVCSLVERKLQKVRAYVMQAREVDADTHP